MGVQPKTKVDRNEPCPCGSKLKFKWCHGDTAKQMICSRVANEHMVCLIFQEQRKRGLIPYNYACNSCGYDFDEPARGQLSDLPLCPKCQSTNLTKNEIQENQENAEEKN